MSSRQVRSAALAAVLVAFSISAAVNAQRAASASAPQGAEQTIAAWKAKPREVAQQMIKKYGPPQEVTANRLIWHNNGPWKFTELVNEEIPHDFPMAHHDMLFQTIAYRIGDQKNAAALFEYDGSVIVERTKGELSARCDKEEANFLAINLAHDVVTGKRSVDEARRFYADSIGMMMKGKPNDYLQGLRFKPAAGNQGDRDKAVM
jgi:hypothetical protein